MEASWVQGSLFCSMMFLIYLLIIVFWEKYLAHSACWINNCWMVLWLKPCFMFYQFCYMFCFILIPLYLFSRAAITNYQKLCGQTSRGQPSEIKVLAGLHPLNGSRGECLLPLQFLMASCLPGLWQHNSSIFLHLHVDFPCVYFFSSSYKDISIIIIN